MKRSPTTKFTTRAAWGDRVARLRAGFVAIPGRSRSGPGSQRRATILIMVVGLLAMLFVIVTAYLTLARFDRLTIQQVENRRTMERIVDGANELAMAAMRNELADADGELFSGDLTGGKITSYETIPGYRATRYLASNEAVRDQNPAALGVPVIPQSLPTLHLDMGNVRYPAVSDLTSSGATLAPAVLSRLLSDSNEDGVINESDLKLNSSVTFMDADGDGLPDADFIGSSSLTELANVIAGRPVRVPNTAALYPPVFSGNVDTDREAAWRQYDASARYQVAARVVSHGGMVTLGSEGIGGASVWNRQFLDRIFRGIKKELNSRSLLDRNADNNFDADDVIDTNFNRVASSVAQIEPILRRRGGLLPAYNVPNGTGPTATATESRVPEVLQELEGMSYGFPQTLVSEFRPSMNGAPKKKQNWQRFSLVSGYNPPYGASEWQAWQHGAFLKPETFYGTDPDNPSSGFAYDRRHLLTTISNSDEIARNQRALLNPATAMQGLGLRRGQLRYWLGEITNTDPARKPQGAFRIDGTFNTDVSGTTTVGEACVRRIADYYFDMLSSYKETSWNTTREQSDASFGSDSTVTLREQALMLAVNTVAFAAPRDATTGFIDTVFLRDGYTTDLGSGATQRQFVGYAPQPFITQAIVHNQPSGSPTNYNLALGIELFNPGEPRADDVGSDTDALYLPQFAISLNNEYEGTGGVPDPLKIRPLDPALYMLDASPVGPTRDRLSGRRFFTFALHGGSNTTFDNVAGWHGRITDLPITAATDASGGAQSITIKLWRRNAEGTYFLVDRVKLDTTSAGMPLPGDEEWSGTVARDTRQVAFFEDNNGARPPARWSMVADEATGSGPSIGGADTSQMNLPGPDPATPAPVVPLYTMNARLGVSIPMHDASARPNSFPTPGFLLFVPRFSHMSMIAADGTVIESLPVTRILQVEREHTYMTSSTYRADFGHMPIFDNRQDVESTSYFADSRTGKLPWGLLVFDYFTTLDVHDPNGDGNFNDAVDPLRVPGRININTAPWYVLAQLPVLNPETQINQTGSPAFWDRASGVLNGQDTLGGTTSYLRFDRNTSTSPIDVTNAGEYRLGTRTYTARGDLAVAAASYRDRVSYLPPPGVTGSSPYFSGSEFRNGADASGVSGGDPEGTRNTAMFGEIRGQAAGATGKLGFVSVGELLNVRGFDSRYQIDVAYPEVDPLMPSLGMSTGDFVKAVSLMALLDTHYLTTRSNTFTIYLTVTDREKPQSSVRSQVTVDRSNILPRGVDTNADGRPDVTLKSNALPEVVGQREIGYYNAQYDE